jgi:acetyl esterase/lipase
MASPYVNVRGLAASFAALLALTAVCGAGAAVPPNLTLSPDGTVHADGLIIPPSSFLSPGAKTQLTERLHDSPPPSAVTQGIVASRAYGDSLEKRNLDQWLAIYPTDFQSTTLGGVHVVVVTPKSGVAPSNANRVLINVHGGGFYAGARYGGESEATPVAGRGRIKVVAIDYRLAPEYIFPAASEDVEKVYVELLKTYKPENIGLYGCSAGGTLTGQSIAWFVHKGLPLPAAIGIFCSGLMPSYWFGGDSGAVAPTLNATKPEIDPTVTKVAAGPRFYVPDAEANNPLATPGLSKDLLAKFPPTLLVTGTRDVAMSNALITNVRLQQAGVETQLLVLEGLGHGQFNTFGGTPEAADAYDIIWRFFDRHLGH